MTIISNAGGSVPPGTLEGVGEGVSEMESFRDIVLLGRMEEPPWQCGIIAIVLRIAIDQNLKGKVFEVLFAILF
jgi:hypothetical protein